MKLRKTLVYIFVPLYLALIGYLLVDYFTPRPTLPDRPVSPIPYALARMDSANAAIDLKESIKLKDLRFVGVYGVGITVPGVSEKCAYYCVKHKGWLKMIEGTSDMITSKKQMRLQGLADKYAAEYNSLLFDYLKRNRLLPSELR